MTIRNTTRTALAMTAVAATAFAISATAGSNTAEAKKLIIKIGHGHHFVHHHLFRPRLVVPLIATSYVGGCYWLKAKALDTGSPYWWNRYAACRGF